MATNLLSRITRKEISREDLLAENRDLADELYWLTDELDAVTEERDNLLSVQTPFSIMEDTVNALICPVSVDRSKCGGCPTCGQHDGYLTISSDERWFRCDRHQLKWLAAKRGNDDVRFHWNSVEWHRNRELLSSYEEVSPVFPLPQHTFREPNVQKTLGHATKVALERVIQTAWEPSLADFRGCVAKYPTRDWSSHHFVSLVYARAWLEDDWRLCVEEFCDDLVAV